MKTSSKWVLASTLALGVFTISGEVSAEKSEAPTALPLKAGIVDTTGDHDTSITLRGLSDGEWVPKLETIVHVPGISDQDLLALQFRAGKKKVGKPFTCKPNSTLTEYQKDFKSEKHDASLGHFVCRFPESYKQKKSGTYSLDVSLRQIMQEKTVKLGSLQFKVFDIKQGSERKPVTFRKVNHDPRLGFALLYEQATMPPLSSVSLRSVADGHLRVGLSKGEDTRLNLRFWTKQERESAAGSYSLACFYKGKQVAKAKTSQRYGGSPRYWTYAGKKKKDIKWRERFFGITQLQVRHANSTSTYRNPEYHYLDQNPGSYECKVASDTGVVASVKFEVADGRVVRNACTDDINATSNVTVVPLLERKKLSTEKTDKKLLASPFFGRAKWSKGCPPRK